MKDHAGWSQLAAKKGKAYNIDGVARSREEEKKLNECFKEVFKEGGGRRVLEYLKSISIHAIHGPNIDPHSLMHVEGQRYIIALIEQRIEDGRQDRR